MSHQKQLKKGKYIQAFLEKQHRVTTLVLSVDRVMRNETKVAAKQLAANLQKNGTGNNHQHVDKYVRYLIYLSWYNGKRRRRDALTRKSAPALNSHRDVKIIDVLIHLWLC